MSTLFNESPHLLSKYFPTNYHLTFLPDLEHYHTSFNYNYTPDKIEQRSTINEETFEVFIDVKDFQPEEIAVKFFDEFIFVEGKQEKRDRSTVPRHFVRHYKLPDFFVSEDVHTRITDDGILEITCKPASEEFRHLEELKTESIV